MLSPSKREVSAPAFNFRRPLGSEISEVRPTCDRTVREEWAYWASRIKCAMPMSVLISVMIPLSTPLIFRLLPIKSPSRLETQPDPSFFAKLSLGSGCQQSSQIQAWNVI